MAENQILESLISKIEYSSEDALATLERISSIPEQIAAQDIIDNSTRQRENGIFYTDFHLAQIAISEALETSDNPLGTFLEPCVGGGSFYFAFIDQSMRKTLGTSDDLAEILNRCYIAENDEVAIETIQKAAPSYFKARYGYDLKIPSKNIFFGNSLWSTDENKIQDFRKIFNVSKGFDFVVTNPPYKLIKKDKRQGENSSKSIIAMVEEIKASKELKYIQGVPNLYKLFVEAISCNWVADSGTIGLLIPKSLLSDYQSRDLREHILDKFELGSIFSIPEGSSYFKGVGQAFSMFVAKKGNPTTKIVFADVPKPEQQIISRSAPLKIELVRKFSRYSAIHNVGPKEQKLLNHLEDFQKIGSIPGLVNFRGEFDMSLDTGFISETESELKLVQGSNLGHFQLNKLEKFVSLDFLNRPKGRWVSQGRIACQQISNMSQRRRMKWAYIPPGNVLGNSCNFLGLESGELWSLSEESIYYFLAILNSSLINERFRLLSPNNHVSNGEIDSLPVGDLSAPEFLQIVDLSRQISSSFNQADFKKLDELVLMHFQFTDEDKYWEKN